MFVKLSDLPQCVVTALAQNGYHKPDIEVKAQETYTINPGTAFEGNRGFICAVNLATGENRGIMGSWGGATPFERGTIDHSVESPPILPNMVVIKGESGGRGTFARLYVAPATLATFLPSPKAELTEAQGVVLYCLKGLKSSYRKDEAARYGVDSAAYASAISELAGKGLAKVASNGAAQITTEGKNALASFALPKAKFY